MKQYLLQTADSQYWLWYEGIDGPQLNGPHSDKMVNLPVIQVENPVGWTPQDQTIAPEPTP